MVVGQIFKKNTSKAVRVLLLSQMMHQLKIKPAAKNLPSAKRNGEVNHLERLKKELELDYTASVKPFADNLGPIVTSKT